MSTSMSRLKHDDLMYWNHSGDHLVVLLFALVERWTRDRKVAGSTPGRGAMKSTRSTQPSIPAG